MQIRTEAEFKGHLTKEQELRRRHFVELAWNLPLFFPRRSFIDPGILERVNRYAGQGGGVVFAITHFSARDVLDFALIASRFDILNARRADTPIALHQAARREIKMFGYQISANFWPVFIEDTVQALKAGKYHWPDGKAPETREIVALNEAYINGVREGVFFEVFAAVFLAGAACLPGAEASWAFSMSSSRCTMRPAWPSPMARFRMRKRVKPSAYFMPTSQPTSQKLPITRMIQSIFRSP